MGNIAAEHFSGFVTSARAPREVATNKVIHKSDGNPRKEGNASAGRSWV